ncbi:MAG TPA: PKD domain-containing protein, partial [Candidatus Hydrogenedentes bacterium]|nr:PKD domain-containing protein [Candidatus Hydrogenedentota bacterium]
MLCHSARNALAAAAIGALVLIGCPKPKEPPVAAFVADFIEGEVPFQVTFTDTSLPGTADITEWAWDFGDGGTSAQQNPTHVYEAIGAYSVSLTVRTEHGEDTETKEGYINAIHSGCILGEAALTLPRPGAVVTLPS